MSSTTFKQQLEFKSRKFNRNLHKSLQNKTQYFENGVGKVHELLEMLESI